MGGILHIMKFTLLQQWSEAAAVLIGSVGRREEQQSRMNKCVN
jgi:hypothetical protein